MRTLKLTHEEIAMIQNALDYLSNEALENYKQVRELENFDPEKRNTTENQYALKVFERYGNLCSEIKEGQKDV
jgi:hypothetical protein